MTTSSADPVAAITEAEASGEIAEIYADIRATLGVPVVNLIWRHLATIPGGLPWAWGSVKPLYDSSAIDGQAAALRAASRAPGLSGLSTATLTAVGLSSEDLATIETVLRSYERSNASSIIATSALLAALEGLSTATPPTQTTAEPATVTGGLPAALTLGEMPTEVRALVMELHQIGGADEIVPTMYRHLAHWPAYLTLLHVLLAPIQASGELAPVIAGTLKAARDRGASLSGGLGQPGVTLMPEDREQVHAALVQFTGGPLAKMIAIVAVIRAAMPS